ncbi:hypothetical protein [Enterovibrio coralii]|uniref:hypothetical protein n=1 Tax=Enterovibrio coralii TaxID=294935 RepID=UPI000AE46129
MFTKRNGESFSLSEDGIDAMLAVWAKKGMLKITLSKKGGEEMAHYHWVQSDELGLVVIQ